MRAHPGDDDRLVESSRYIANYVRGNLTRRPPKVTFSGRDLEQMRRNLTAITDQLSGDLDIADPGRATAILDDANALPRT